jgi:hypothetical protein
LNQATLGDELGAGEPSEQSLVVVPGGLTLSDGHKDPVVFEGTGSPRATGFKERAVGVNEVHGIRAPGFFLVPGRFDQRRVQLFELTQDILARLPAGSGGKARNGLITGGTEGHSLFGESRQARSAGDQLKQDNS